MKDRRKKAFSGSEAGNELSEQELLEWVRSKDPAGQRCFYERYAGYLTAVCARYIGDRSQLKDVLQESFIQIYSHLDGFVFRGEGSVRAWVRRIVVNHALKALRGAGRLVFVDDVPDAPEEEPSGLPNVPTAVVQEMICALPDGYRTVFNLFVFEKKSHREIAELLGIKEDSSASQFFRARALLAKNIKQYMKQHDNG